MVGMRKNLLVVNLLNLVPDSDFCTTILSIIVLILIFPKITDEILKMDEGTKLSKIDDHVETVAWDLVIGR